MKIAITCDTHFGDKTCQLVTEKAKGNVDAGDLYPTFRDAAGVGNDYLVLVGDIFDFSIASYDEAYKYGKVFFKLIQQDGVAKEIIYLPGNHDADMWHILQHQRSVINKIHRGEPPVPFRHSVAGIIDDRKGTPPSKAGLTLYKVTVQPGPGPKYAGMFLDEITVERPKSGQPASGEPTFFNFAYPNLYILTEDETVLVTHGQYLEAAWAIIGELGSTIAYDDLKVGEVDVEEMVEMNFPLNQLLCTGIGEAGVLKDLARQIQFEVKNNDLKKIRNYLDRLEEQIDLFNGWYNPLRLFAYFGKKKLLKKIGGVGTGRNNNNFIEEILPRLERFYRSTLLEIKEINEKTKWNILEPTRIIYGHTHCPRSWDNPETISKPSSLPPGLLLSNGGGWVVENKQFCGAEVFTYDTQDGKFRSKAVG